ncbi:response regulator transcription factor [Altericista sp. CCNU0014]|uniref:response regulator transcription factor n=1 Tax=Altericista sp. CCNU0014 TaxID=3082949 RepID=UPI00384DB9E1
MESAFNKASAIEASTGHILLVEDEETIRETICLTLRGEGYSVVTAADGRTALDLIRTYSEQPQGGDLPPLDLVILDIMLPGINGLDLCRFLRREGSAIPVLMLSAKGTEGDRVVGLEVGADDYLTKPFGMRELVARCRALLRRQRLLTNESANVIRCRDISLYPQECRVTVNDREVNLSPKEFRILELFISYPRRVWPREQLLEKIWGPDFIGDSKTVDVHIRWLREKIEKDPSNPDYLVTVRGFGYRFG